MAIVRRWNVSTVATMRTSWTRKKRSKMILGVESAQSEKVGDVVRVAQGVERMAGRNECEKVSQLVREYVGVGGVC